MSRYLKSLYILFICIALSSCSFLGKEIISDAQNGIEAGLEFRNVLQQGDDTMIFKGQVDKQELFTTLESIYPYAFSIKYVTVAGGMFSAQVIIDNQSAQDEAIKIAKKQTELIIDGDMTIVEKLETIHNYIVKNCEYDVEASENISQDSPSDSAPFTAEGVFKKRKAMCAGYSRAFMAMCEQAGIDAFFVADTDMNHGWNAVSYYGEVYYIDCTFDDPVPDRGDVVSARYFMCDEKTLAETHTWDKAFYNNIFEKYFSKNFSYIQKMQDLGIANLELMAEDSLSLPVEKDVEKLEETLRIKTPESVKNTNEMLYKWAFESLLVENRDGDIVIEKLVKNGDISLELARKIVYQIF